MSRKKQKTKDISEIDSVESESELTESAQAEEQPGLGPKPQRSDPNPDLPSDSDAEPSKDELLEEVRRSLIEQETLEQQKQPTLWKRVSKRLKKSKKSDAGRAVPKEEQQPEQAELDISTPLPQPEEEPIPATELNQLDALVNLLETPPERTSVEVAEESSKKEVEAATAEVNLDELKKQVFQPRSEGDVAQELSEVRSIVLEGGEEVFVEVESKPQDSSQERMEAFQNALRPYRPYIYFLAAFLVFVAVVISGLILFRAVQQYLPARPVEEAPALPYPVGIYLPGGLDFTLNRGKVENGEWNPTGPEWLEGSEVCRWVAIPWSLQMEAVIRTLDAGDSLELIMSNNDRLTYRVYSVREVSVDKLPELDTDTPCLQLVLARSDSDVRWVLTAIP